MDILSAYTAYPAVTESCGMGSVNIFNTLCAWLLRGWMREIHLPVIFNSGEVMAEVHGLNKYT